MNIHIVVGKNFGDEGKGLAVDFFSLQAQKKEMSCAVVRHNGGGQAGHTVDLKDKRFVFHQLSSGSFRDAHTLWLDTFMPDLYKLSEEVLNFSALANKAPIIKAMPECRCVYIDDVLRNMAVEAYRGKKRHGSCGMGINETAERSANPEFLLTLGDVKGMTAERLFHELKRIREGYNNDRLSLLGVPKDAPGEYGELLKNDNVIFNCAQEMCRSAELVEIDGLENCSEYDEVVFEGAQGLLLDENYEKYAPHLTSSRTGIYNPAEFCYKYMPKTPAEVVYVTRSYVTRHGEGPLPYEDNFDRKKYNFCDNTNVHNEWQGSLRYAFHGTAREFVQPVEEDLQNISDNFTPSLMITHLNETNGNIFSTEGIIPVDEWVKKDELARLFKKVYCSCSPFAEDI